MKELINMAMSLRNDLHDLNERLKRESRKFSEKLAEEWIDGKRVKKILNISERTLLNLRNDGDLGYSKLKGKFYYKADDLGELLKRNYRRRVRR
jgi:hypothetical protein